MTQPAPVDCVESAMTTLAFTCADYGRVCERTYPNSEAVARAEKGAVDAKAALRAAVASKVAALIAERDTALVRIKAMEGALAFYANPSNYDSSSGLVNLGEAIPPRPILADDGKIARAALAEREAT